MDEQHKLNREINAAKGLTAHLRDILADDIDDDVIHDSIEGETSLHEAIEATAQAVMLDRAHEDALKALIMTLSDRKGRYAHRQELLRTAILSAMEVGEIKKMELPFCTISRAAKAQALEITDEAKIPAKYWKPSDPKLDRKAITEALKSTAADIPGATLDNGGEKLAIRWK